MIAVSCKIEKTISSPTSSNLPDSVLMMVVVNTVESYDDSIPSTFIHSPVHISVVSIDFTRPGAGRQTLSRPATSQLPYSVLMVIVVLALHSRHNPIIWTRMVHIFIITIDPTSPRAVRGDFSSLTGKVPDPILMVIVVLAPHSRNVGSHRALHK